MAHYYLIIYSAVVLAAAGQVLLKMGSDMWGFDIGIMRLNVWVFLGLSAMLFSMLLSIRALSVIPLRDMAFILPTVYVLVPLFSRIFLREKMNRLTVYGTMIIIAGVTLFNLFTVKLF